MITKQQAWRRRDDEVNIGIDKSEYKFKFTRRWFKLRNQVTYSTFLPKRFPPHRPWKVIQIGVFEGMDLVWQMQNLFIHPASRVIAIDPWEATTKLDQQYMDDVYERAQHNLRKWRGQVELVRGYSQQILPTLLNEGAGTYDLIIIDGDHNAPAVYTDAIYSLQLLKVGGWMLFDDVRNQQPKKDHVQKGLDQFMDDFEDNVGRVWFHRFMDCICRLN